MMCTKHGIVTAIAFALSGAPMVALAVPAAPSVAADDVDPAKLAVAREIVAVVLPPEQREQMMSGVLDAMMKNMMTGIIQGSGIEQDFRDNPKLKAVFDRFLARQRELALDDIRDALPGLAEAYARAYTRMFSIEDLRAVAVFVKTPAGMHFVQRGPGLLSDPEIGKWQRDLAAKGAARQPAEMARFKEELMAVRDTKPSGT